MSDIKLDTTTGDIDVTDFVAPRMFTAGEAISAVGQRITIRLRTFLGEWFADTSIGVPWHQQIIGAKNAEGLALAIVRDVIQKTDGVTSVDSISVVLDADRMLVITFTAITSEGPLSLSVDLAPANPAPMPGPLSLTPSGTFVTTDVTIATGVVWRVVGVVDGATASLAVVVGSERATGVHALFVGRGGDADFGAGPAGGGGGGGGLISLINQPVATGDTIAITVAATSSATVNASPAAVAAVGALGAIGTASGGIGALSTVSSPWSTSVGGSAVDASNGGAAANNVAAGAATANPGNGGAGGAGAFGSFGYGGGGGGAGGAGGNALAPNGGGGGAGVAWSSIVSPELLACIDALASAHGGVWSTMIGLTICGGGGGGVGDAGSFPGLGSGGGGDGGTTGGAVAQPGSRPGGGGGGDGDDAVGANGGPSIAVIAWRIQ